MKNLKVLFTVLCVPFLIANNANVYGETVSVSSFSSMSGYLDNGKIVSYNAYKGGGTSAPAVNSNAIRLYQNSSSSTGGYIVISVPNGYKITSATIGSSMATTTGYYINSKPDGTSTPAKKDFVISNQSLSANGTYEVTGLNTQYITFACFGNSSSSRLYCNYLSVTYSSSGSTETTVSFDPFSIDFGTVTVGETKSKEVSVAISNAMSDISLSVNGSGLSVSPSSLSQNGKVTVTYKPTAVGSLNGTLTASGGGLTTDVTATITATAQAPTTYYTVTWMVGGAEYTTTSVKSGNKATPPTPPADNALSCANTFMGWSKQNLGSNTGQGAPSDLFKDVSPDAITENTIFYAVFATKQTN